MMGQVFYMEMGDVHTEPVNVPVGTMWLFRSNGTFTAPADGKYQVEIHGGGGGAAVSRWGNGGTVASGGGSGELYEVSMSKDEQVSVTIGSGGAAALGDGTDYEVNGSAGGSTTFGSLSCAGGGGAMAQSNGIADDEYRWTGGAKSGSLATSGTGSYEYSYSSLSASAGQGNKNNTAQTYGDGGAVSSLTPNNGKAGAVIVTYLGKE